MKTTIGTLALASLSIFAVEAQQYVISTVAGGAPHATGIAGVAFLGLPRGVAADGAGNVYFSAQSCVFKLDPNGVTTRVAGNFRVGYSGDGGPPISAPLNGPGGVG